ncbi:TetR/AcrR family transcriptional regulator [Alkalihalobacillus sp. 1P02AB]|uniref:TetR/AcrR family transcriptional regulator n=1 Tax=Alkalihalobacillus sp. 1P02AB TaxID=3132260 RepID=UPI0039A76E11
MTSKLDRRKQYTRMVLKDSLMKLLLEKPITKVTIKELCERADINRSTFYSHYKDQYELLYKIEEEIIEEMYLTLSQHNFTTESETLQLTKKIVEYVAEKSEVCQTLLGDHGSNSFQKRVMAITHELLIKKWTEENHLPLKSSKYIALFTVSGSIQVIQHWLAEGMKESPEEIAQLINDFTNKGLSFMNPSNN